MFALNPKSWIRRCFAALARGRSRSNSPKPKRVMLAVEELEPLIVPITGTPFSMTMLHGTSDWTIINCFSNNTGDMTYSVYTNPAHGTVGFDSIDQLSYNPL